MKLVRAAIILGLALAIFGAGLLLGFKVQRTRFEWDRKDFEVQKKIMFEEVLMWREFFTQEEKK
jgi:hypothetical protein